MAMRRTQQMELAFLHEDRTWSTELLDVPLMGGNVGESVQNFWERTLSKAPTNRKIVAVLLFDESPQPRD